MLRLQIVASLAVLMCGSALVWRRRDNILAYLQGGFFFASALLPLIGTPVLEDSDDYIVHLYAQVLVVGALAFTVGLLVGALVEAHSTPLRMATFGHDLRGPDLRTILRRVRLSAIGSVVLLLAAFHLMGFTPFFAEDRLAAKYGVGAYSSGRIPSLVYQFALNTSAAILPVVLVAFWHRRRVRDFILSGALLIGLALSLQRGFLFTGMLVGCLAVLIQRWVRASLLLAAACLAFILGALSNEVILNRGASVDRPLGERVAAGAPDIQDHLRFLTGFERSSEFTQGRTILGRFTPGRGYWDPSRYALRTATGIDYAEDQDQPSGGLRLPAPLWGYSSFGFAGAAGVSLASGLFTGWGARRWKRLLSPVGQAGYALNVAIAVLVYNGTVGLLARFYFLGPVDFVYLAVAVFIGLFVRVRIRDTEPWMGTFSPPRRSLRRDGVRASRHGQAHLA